MRRSLAYAGVAIVATALYVVVMNHQDAVTVTSVAPPGARHAQLTPAPQATTVPAPPASPRATALPTPRFTAVETAILGYTPSATAAPTSGAEPAPGPAVFAGVALSPEQRQRARDVFAVAAAEIAEARPLLERGDRDGFRAAARHALDDLWSNLDGAIGTEKAAELQAAVKQSAAEMPAWLIQPR